jgi:hypothetical protein
LERKRGKERVSLVSRGIGYGRGVKGSSRLMVEGWVREVEVNDSIPINW